MRGLGGSSRQAAPPHTRGSTLLDVACDDVPLGSPAHAGIDPRSISTRSPTARLPRTRGDRPGFPGAGRSSPIGSPAHAGIDPRARCRRAHGHRLPRTRGDRPASTLVVTWRPEAPPHTRGSTGWVGPNALRVLGSPAHAGIDPMPPKSVVYLLRLPRTRGDRPGVNALCMGVRPAPPHTRGSTHAGHRLRGPDQGSPAHAGIDRLPCNPRAESMWLPRTRGDRPSRDVRRSWRVWAPPHTRGSTPGIHRLRQRAEGSPAHAGIDPHCPVSPRGDQRLPRTRGDRPFMGSTHAMAGAAPPHTRGSTQDHAPGDVVVAGSPAHAGIDPCHRLRVGVSARLPRTRGDRPSRPMSAGSAMAAPPHTRGSTPDWLGDENSGDGSPADAGIDPRTWISSGRPRWLPRTRGDRPSAMVTSPKRLMAPPHTRGSTVPGHLTRRHRHGSPAHAGIDPCSAYVQFIGGGLPRTRGDRPLSSSDGSG